MHKQPFYHMEISSHLNENVEILIAKGCNNSMISKFHVPSKNWSGVYNINFTYRCVVKAVQAERRDSEFYILRKFCPSSNSMPHLQAPKEWVQVHQSAWKSSLQGLDTYSQVTGKLLYELSQINSNRRERKCMNNEEIRESPRKSRDCIQVLLWNLLTSLK